MQISLCFSESVVQNVSADHVHAHIGTRYRTRPYECLAYHPSVPNNPHSGKGVGAIFPA